jgi:AraC-like DNA-binding protein
MDTLSSVMDGHRARGASLLRCEMRAPWALRIEDGAAVGVIVMVSGEAWLVPGSSVATRLVEGDVAVVRGPLPYAFADSPETPPTVVIEPGNVCRSLTGEHLALSMGLGTRTWGNSGSATGPGLRSTFLSATWELSSQVSGRLLDAVPEVAVVPAGEVDPALADLLAREVQRDLPGQDVVLDRLVDLVLVSALRQWFSRPESDPPAWWAARSDPVVGRALALVHDEPGRDWSLERLAAAVHVSRATLSRRFTDLVGQSPMAYLAQWRLACAADLLSVSSDSVEQIARRVGYTSPFAFSAAFRREYGRSPRAFRSGATPGVTSPVDPVAVGPARSRS